MKRKRSKNLQKPKQPQQAKQGKTPQYENKPVLAPRSRVDDLPIDELTLLENDDKIISELEKKQEEEEDEDSIFYDSEDSENERTLLTIGDVPLEWYEDYDHFGYDLEGNPVTKPAQRNAIDEFLSMNEAPRSWRQVYDSRTGKNVFLSEKDMMLIKQLRKGGQSEKYDPKHWYWEFNELTDTVHPLTNYPERKNRFIPSKWELKRINKIRDHIRKGYIKLDDIKQKNKPQTETKQFYDIWSDTTNVPNPGHIIPAPKVRLPGHNESYNPPEEYLLDENEKKSWELLEPNRRPFNFLPQKYSSLRLVPNYHNYMKERFERCLELYLCKRIKRVRTRVDPRTLIPKLPNPEDLKPFPTTEKIQYLGHEGRVRSISVIGSGEWLLSGSDDKTVRLWEVDTGRCVQKWDFESTVHSLAWNPNNSLFLFAVVATNSVYIIDPGFGNDEQIENNNVLFEPTIEPRVNDKIKPFLLWTKPTEEQSTVGIRYIIQWKMESSSLKSVTWHAKGDYFATVGSKAASMSVLIHQLSKRLSQNPFQKTKGIAQVVRFHPTEPYFFVASQKFVRVYNLAQQSIIKTLTPAMNWISSMSIHPKGDNVIIGSYDKRVVWIDMDLSVKPWKSIKYHDLAVRQVCYHAQFPLFATCSDDGTIHIFHGMVYSDLLQNPLVIPLKILKGHKTINNLGVLDVSFHPQQPWIFSAGSDSTIRLWV